MTKHWFFGFASIACVALAGCPKGEQNATTPRAPAIAPPVAERIPHKTEIHGITLEDDYFWMRDRDDPKVIAYLEAENQYTESVMQHTRPLQETLFKEMKQRIKQTDLSVPVKIDDYWYYSRTEEGKQYYVLCRKQGSLDAPEQVLLDVNQLAEGKPYLSVGMTEVSPDHRILAYSTDETGAEVFTMRFKNLDTGEVLADVIEDVYYDATWAADSKTLFYTMLDDAKRSDRVLRHTLGSSAPDPVVFREDDQRFHVSVSSSKSKKYVFIKLDSQITSEVHFIDAANPTGTFELFQARQQGVEYRIAHHTDWFYVVTNQGAKNFKLMKTPIADRDPARWQEISGHRDDVKLDRVEMFRDHLVLHQRKGGFRSIEIWNLTSGERHDISFPEPVYTVFGHWNPDFNATTLRFLYTSLVTPRSVYEYDMNTRARALKKQQEVLGGYNPASYRTERLFATASDGTQIPISLVYARTTKPSAATPLLVSGYGSYGSSSDPRFSSSRLSLLDRGFILATAHIRGGGELGRLWYEDGKLLNKKNTFTDFIAVMEHLIKQGFTSSDKLGITGGSAGGLLIGAVLNMRPDLPRFAIAQVPFVDVVNTMLDDTIPLTVIEFEEWGNPRDKQYFDYMRSYSPYDNVAAAAYPDLLITAGLNDPRVQYWEPAKWTAKLRATKTDNNRLLLKTNMGAGHGGATGRYDYLREVAFHYAFMLDTLGIEN